MRKMKIAEANPPMQDLCAIIMAAGQSTRMHSDLVKVRRQRTEFLRDPHQFMALLDHDRPERH